MIHRIFHSLWTTGKGEFLVVCGDTSIQQTGNQVIFEFHHTFRLLPKSRRREAIIRYPQRLMNLRWIIQFLFHISSWMVGNVPFHQDLLVSAILGYLRFSHLSLPFTGCQRASLWLVFLILRERIILLRKNHFTHSLLEKIYSTLYSYPTKKRPNSFLSLSFVCHGRISSLSRLNRLIKMKEIAIFQI